MASALKTTYTKTDLLTSRIVADDECLTDVLKEARLSNSNLYVNDRSRKSVISHIKPSGDHWHRINSFVTMPSIECH